MDKIKNIKIFNDYLLEQLNIKSSMLFYKNLIKFVHISSLYLINF